MRLTKTNIESLGYTKSGRCQQIYWDDRLPGFGVRVHPSGHKTYVVKYRVGVTQKLVALANVELLSVEEARERARKMIVKALEHSSPTLAITREIQFGDFCTEYMDRHARRQKKSWKEDQRRIDKYLLPAWRDRLLISIKRPDVSALLDRVGAKFPIQANRIKEQLSKMFDLAMTWGYLAEDARNPTRGIGDNKEEPRKRWLKDEELVRIGRALRDERNIYVQAAILMLAMVPWRLQECLRLRWDEIDFEAREVCLPANRRKTQEAHVMPIGDEVIEHLQEIPRIADNPYVFCGKVRGQPLYTIQKNWERTRKRAGVDDAWLHDLRRTGATKMLKAGHRLEVVSQSLGHSDVRLTREHYGFLESSDTRAAIEDLGRKIKPLLFASRDTDKRNKC